MVHVLQIWQHYSSPSTNPACSNSGCLVPAFSYISTLQMNFLNNSIGFLLKDVYGLNLPAWPSKPCTMHTGRPSYLSDVLQRHKPMRSLRSSSSHQLSVPRHILTFESRAFQLSAPRVWNSSPVGIREFSVTSCFQTSSKDILLSVSLRLFSCPPCLEYFCPHTLILPRLWCYVSRVRAYLPADLRR